MEFRWQGLNHRLHFSFEKIESVTGVNSKIDEKNHFLMWDFDNMPLQLTLQSLETVQSLYNLPDIIILSTGKLDSYHAYCFKRCTFVRARTILASTPNIDLKYLGLGIMRGYFTLRFSDVDGRTFSQIAELPGKIKSDCSYGDASCFVNYTKRQK